MAKLNDRCQFLLLSPGFLYGRHVGARRKGTNKASLYNCSINLNETFFPNHAGMKNRADLNLGEVVFLSIIYYIPDS